MDCCNDHDQFRLLNTYTRTVDREITESPPDQLQLQYGLFSGKHKKLTTYYDVGNRSQKIDIL